eukprot:snap_masked-scaffold_10-processed-gene-10.24-mRNA-1 protein AED:1.00 eAED:1.00 QI:0/-1/0/0/-1/1/1/0/358
MNKSFGLLQRSKKKKASNRPPPKPLSDVSSTTQTQNPNTYILQPAPKKGGLEKFPPVLDNGNRKKSKRSKRSKKSKRKRAKRKIVEVEGKSHVVRIGSTSREGLHHENEDRVAEEFNLTPAIDAFAGVFDGHGGTDCAQWVSTNFSRFIKKYFSDPRSWDDGEEVIANLFAEVEDEFMTMAEEEDETSGSCATAILIKGYEAIIANIGDCRAVAGFPAVGNGNKGFKQLTNDHRADLLLEKERIGNAGGNEFVRSGRILSLEPSRTFGDLDIKEIANTSRRNILISQPEVKKVRMVKDAFIIVATDGLWDTVSNEMAVNFTRNMLASTGDPAFVASCLVELAAKRQSEDDITITIVAW